MRKIRNISLIIYFKVEPLMTALMEIISGLGCFDVLNIIKSNKVTFEHVFCPSNVFKWKYENFVEIISPLYNDKVPT